MKKERTPATIQWEMSFLPSCFFFFSCASSNPIRLRGRQSRHSRQSQEAGGVGRSFSNCRRNLLRRTIYPRRPLVEETETSLWSFSKWCPFLSLASLSSHARGVFGALASLIPARGKGRCGRGNGGPALAFHATSRVPDVNSGSFFFFFARFLSVLPRKLHVEASQYISLTTGLDATAFC